MDTDFFDGLFHISIFTFAVVLLKKEKKRKAHTEFISCLLPKLALKAASLQTRLHCKCKAKGCKSAA